MTSFPLAPMSALIRGLTWMLLLLPGVFAWLSSRAPGPVSALLAGVAVLLVGLYAAVWLVFRPSRFEVTRSALRIVWPVRSRDIPRASIRRVRLMDSRSFRQEVGMAFRVGVGGLWGGFGWLWTPRGLYELWVSRQDGLVLVEREGGRPLLLTPADPERFARMFDGAGG